MKRADLEHVLRAAAALTDQREFIVIGSQAILGARPDAPDILLRSMEADLYPRARPELAEVIDGAIGELSPFHQTFGYYAQGVGPETAVLPRGWADRLHRVETPNTGGGAGLCLDPVDLAVAKLIAGREKDGEFVEALLDSELVAVDDVRHRLAAVDGHDVAVDAAKGWLTRRRNTGRAG